MKYYIIAGEASGDLHGSNLIKEIRKLDTDAEIRSWGGDKMEAEGATLAMHYRDLAFMGFAEVVKNLPAIFKNIAFCKRDISKFKPDVVVLINYSAFNLRIAEWTRKNNFRNVFYISPQVWAWKESRVKSIKKFVDKMIVILPFEKAFYDTWSYDVEYVGHPLVQVVDNFKADHPEIHPSFNMVALLPGSRKQEIRKKLPVMLEATKNFPTINFALAKAPSIDDSFYESFLANYKNVEVVSNGTYELLMKASAALVTSGTATLETALFGVPEIVCYKAGNISYQIGKRLIKLKFISLVNLIMNREVVKELIQDKLNAENITKELNDILYDPVKREKMQFDYYLLRKQLFEGGNASAKAAKIIVESLGKTGSYVT
ncbi:MAG: lipid-A-disaccharide synthase [Ginsengibacter sp.]